MNILKQLIRLMTCCLLCLTVAACISSKYVEQKQYLLNLKTLPEKKIKESKCLVAFDHMMAIPPFDQHNFLYRINDNQYLTDYYHSFLVAPTEQLDPVFRSYLKARGNFDLDVTGLAAAPNQLQVQLTEFYADYRVRARPYAVVALHFVLSKSTKGKRIVLLDKTLHAKVALKIKNTETLLWAWNICLQNIFTRGMRELNSALSECRLPHANGNGWIVRPHKKHQARD